jgi:site-specific recombinase XerD
MVLHENMAMALPLHDEYDKFNQAMEHNPAFRRWVCEQAVMQKGIAEAGREMLLMDFDVDEQIRDFIARQDAANTRKSYQTALRQLKEFCARRRCDIPNFSPADGDRFTAELKERCAYNTVKTKTTALSAFFNYLSANHPGLFQTNPFARKKLGRKTLKYVRHYSVNDPNFQNAEADVAALISEFRRINRPELALIISLIRKYGFRVSSFYGMNITGRGGYTFFSKTRGFSGRFTKEEMEEIRGLKKSGRDITEIKGALISNKVKRYTHKLYKEKKVSCEFSVHDLRRLFIYEKLADCSGDDVAKVAALVGHESPGTTLAYVTEMFNGNMNWTEAQDGPRIGREPEIGGLFAGLE